MTEKSEAPRGGGPRNYLTLPQQFEIHRLLQEQLSCIDSKDKIYEFGDGCSDESIAAQVDFSCTPYNVKSVRLQMFGELSKRGPTTDREAILSLERRVGAMHALLIELADAAGLAYE